MPLFFHFNIAELPVVRPCSLAVAYHRRFREHPAWTVCPLREPVAAQAQKPRYPLLCQKCWGGEDGVRRVRRVRVYAQQCMDMLDGAISAVEHSERNGVPPSTKEHLIRAVLYLAEVATYARLAVAHAHTLAEREDNRSKAGAAYEKYLCALGPFYRTLWLEQNPPAQN
ncbi:hypothetical protein B0I37DRAFT_351909 [Chaetomium sp. MPI-CAGE-AT-0009]|nr:hypothetical protein B0I37DRAFT_351909 [Chaetomium sp. MPI-CAGE-AT-0009]